MCRKSDLGSGCISARSHLSNACDNDKNPQSEEEPHISLGRQTKTTRPALIRYADVQSGAAVRSLRDRDS